MRVFFHSDELKLFREEGVFNYSTMLMRDDLGVMLLGAREAIYAVDINNISVRKAAVRRCEEIHKKDKYLKCGGLSVLVSVVLFEAVK